MNENQTSKRKSHTNNTPFRSNQNEKRKKINIQRENKLQTQKEKVE
jgi:hypothetical protein